MVEATVEERGNGSPEISWREHGLIVATGLVVWARTRSLVSLIL